MVASNELRRRLGERVRRRRDELGLRQADLAERTGLDDSTIRAIEAGRRGVSMDTLVGIAEALMVPPGALIASEPASADGLDAEAAHIVRSLEPGWQRAAIRILRELNYQVSASRRDAAGSGDGSSGRAP